MRMRGKNIFDFPWFCAMPQTIGKRVWRKIHRKFAVDKHLRTRTLFALSRPYFFAYVAVAEHCGNALGGACTQKFYFHNQDFGTEGLLEKYEDLNCFRALYPCYDRNLTYGYRDCVRMEKDGTGLILRLLSFFEKILSEHPIDCIFSENVSNSFLYAAYLAGKKNGVVYAGLIPSRIPGRYELWTDEFGNIPFRESLFAETDAARIPEDEKREILDYISSIAEKKPDYMENNITSMNIGYIRYYLRKAGDLREI